jgi:O-antigen ligase
MSAGPVSLPKQPQTVHPGMAAVVFWLPFLSLIPVAALVGFGAMAFLMMALAAGLAGIVWVRPEEAPGVGVLFLFAASVLLPSSARLDFFAQSAWEMYFWAAGVLLITVAAIARIGARQVFNVPTSAKAFLAVALLAAIFGLKQGASPSYVLRQFYGVLLMVVYFGVALHVGSQALFIRRIQTFGTLCALMFVVYFLAVFANYGFHREMTTVGTQASLLATVLFFAGLQQKRYSYVLGAMILLCVPILIFQRGAVLTFLAALPLAAAIKFRTKKLRVLACLVFLFIALAGVVPGVAEKVGEAIETTPVIGSILPPGSVAADTLVDRGLQLVTAVGTVEAHPWLGTGLGSEIEWESPTLGFRQVPFIENGWAYLLQKMGLLGAVAFLCFLFTVLRHISRESLGFSACVLAIAGMAMFSNATFFHFTTAPLAGTFAGLLLAKKDHHDTQAAAISSALDLRNLDR